MSSTTKPTTYLLTGGAGFIGSHLAERLLSIGHRVLALDNLSTGSANNIAHLLKHERYQFVRAEITDANVIDRMASESDVIVHLAAAVGVKLIVERPVATIETNVMGTEQILKAALRYNCRILLASTSEVYGKGHKFPFSEDDDVLLGPTCRTRWGYAASKMLDEFLGLAYHREYGLDVVIFRLFNTVGARQTGRYGMVIPRFVRQAMAGEPITVYGDGEQRRCFCDVRDVIRAMTGLAGSAEAVGRVFNIGNREEVSMNQLAERIKTLIGSDSPIVHIPYDEAYLPGFEDMQRRVPCTKRIESLLRWSPDYTLDDILKSVHDYEAARDASA